MIDMEKLKFDEKGLIPAIVVDGTSGQVLTLAYMNRESLAISIREERTCFWNCGGRGRPPGRCSTSSTSPPTVTVTPW